MERWPSWANRNVSDDAIGNGFPAIAGQVRCDEHHDAMVSSGAMVRGMFENASQWLSRPVRPRVKAIAQTCPEPMQASVGLAAMPTPFAFWGTARKRLLSNNAPDRLTYAVRKGSP